MKLYETTIIFDSQLKEDGWEKSVAKYTGIIETKGQVKNMYEWGVRRLAYPINKQTHGYYVHILHESDPSVPRELERQFQLDENCLRYLTVLADNPRYLEELEKTKARQVEKEEASRSAAETPPAAAGEVADAAPSADKPVGDGPDEHANPPEAGDPAVVPESVEKENE